MRARQVAVFAVFVLAACAPAAAPAPTGVPAKPTTAPPSPAPAAAPAIPSPSLSPGATKLAGSPVAAQGLPACTDPNPASTVQLASAAPKPASSPAASPAPGQAAPSPQAKAPAPTPTLRPAPTQDRIGFPDGYQQAFKQLYVFDRTDTRQVRYVCANDVATTVKPDEPFPYGSVLVFESWAPKTSGSELARDPNGHLIRETLNTIFVMKKEQGFGVAYGGFRTGEWEYVAYRPDRSHQTTPAQSGNCAACHLGASQNRDWVFRANLFFERDRYGQTPQVGPNEVGMSSMAFAPRTLTVPAGTTVTWKNGDVAPHTTRANDGTWSSGVLPPGGTFSFTLDAPGTFPYVCTLHPDQMTATITVVAR